MVERRTHKPKVKGSIPFLATTHKRIMNAAFFDLDGTLFDTRADLAATVNHTRRDIGLAELPTESVIECVGQGARYLLTHAIPECSADAADARFRRSFEELWEIFRSHYAEHCVETLTAMRFILRRPKYPMMFDSHMLSMASGNRLAGLYEAAFRMIITPRIVKRRYDVIRTQDDDYVNARLGIPREQTPFISFGTDLVHI